MSSHYKRKISHFSEVVLDRADAYIRSTSRGKVSVDTMQFDQHRYALVE